MSDAEVASLLRSDEPLVVVEAPAGCGKTYQGACYAKDTAAKLGSGRLLILAHTHAACDVFSARTAGMSTNVEIRTIASLTTQIASAYHKSLGLPANLEAWAWRDDGAGFGIMATKCASLLAGYPMIAEALSQRYPTIICDEHQDSSADQHSIIMALNRAGSKVRIFGDPLQRIFPAQDAKSDKLDADRWASLKQQGAFAELDYPHRWDRGSRELGQWVLAARVTLRSGQPIDLTGTLPKGLAILRADNLDDIPGLYRVSYQQRGPIDQVLSSQPQLMILAANNKTVDALSAFWNRRIRIWEGYTRDGLTALVIAIAAANGDAGALASAMFSFVAAISIGFTKGSHGDRLIKEAQDGCTGKARGKPAVLQAIAKKIFDDPTHRGVAAALQLLGELINRGAAGFDRIKIDRRAEFHEALRLGEFATVDEGFAELARRRTFSRRSPPAQMISTIHKAKGLEAPSAMVIPCDRGHSTTEYSRCRLYVALSRASHQLTLVVPTTGYTQLFKL